MKDANYIKVIEYVRIEDVLELKSKYISKKREQKKQEQITV